MVETKRVFRFLWCPGSGDPVLKNKNKLRGSSGGHFLPLLLFQFLVFPALCQRHVPPHPNSLPFIVLPMLGLGCDCNADGVVFVLCWWADGGGGRLHSVTDPRWIDQRSISHFHC